MDYLLNIIGSPYFYFQLLGTWIIAIMLAERIYSSRNTIDLFCGVIKERFITSLIVFFIFPVSSALVFGIWLLFDGFLWMKRKLEIIDGNLFKNRRK